MLRFLASLGLASMAPVSALSDVILFEDFEDATVLYTLSEPQYSDGATQFFTRTDGSNTATSYSVTGFGGSSYFAAQDLDGSGTNPATMTFSVDITGVTDLSFSALFAEDDNGVRQDWDVADGFTITTQIDGGSINQVFGIEGSGSGSNFAPRVDTNFDGLGDGAEITDTFAAFAAPIVGTGSTLEVVLTFQLDFVNEDLALDNFSIEGVLAVIPEPTGTLCGCLLASLLGVTVARRPASDQLR